MNKLLCLIALGAIFATPTVFAQSADEARECSTLAKNLQAKQRRFTANSAERDTLLEKAEEAGEIWQNAENIRSPEPESIVKADEARIVYDKAIEDFDTAELALRGFGAQLNLDIAQYNRKCVES